MFTLCTYIYLANLLINFNKNIENLFFKEGVKIFDSNKQGVIMKTLKNLYCKLVSRISS